ncbi:MAG TPA: alpha/beta hydrolase [Gaiellaceae bacterium]
MSDDAALAEALALNHSLEETIASGPRIERLAPDRVRRGRRAGRSIFPPAVYLDEARTLHAPGRGGEIALRVLDAAEPEGVFLHLHGGGWVLGAADLQDEHLRAVADGTGLTAVSVEYRLAPEHPWPAGPDDCEDAAVWLLERGLDELAPGGRLAIGGESAGANLAAVTLLRLRDRHGVSPRRFAAANLVYGSFDLGGTPSRRRWDRQLVLSAPMMEWFDGAYLPGRDAEARRDPGISPLYADLRDLPPALFTVGTEDPLLDDSVLMHARWREAGNEATLSVYEGGAHGFTAFPIELARRSHAEQIAFLRASLAGAGSRAAEPPSAGA